MALLLAEADPARATKIATEAVQLARTAHDHEATSVARRALGVAALHMHDPETAIRHIRAAIAAGHRAGSQELVVDARLRLAFVLNVRGRARSALREIDEILQLDLDVLRRARAHAQRGGVLQHLGQLDEALVEHQLAVPGLRRAGDDLWLQRVLSNRAVNRGYRREFAAAESDLHEAGQICRRAGLELSLGFVHQNLGWLAGIRGDVPTALDLMHQAEECFRRLGADQGELLTDRSELLLSALLVPEARESADRAVRLFERSGRQIGLPEVRLLLAESAALTGQHTEALTQARRAVREFRRQQRTHWAVLGRFVWWRLRMAAGPAPRGAVARLVEVADALDGAGWPTAALEARVLAGRLAIEQGRPHVAMAQLERVARTRQRGHATLRARAWYAEALCRESRGNRRGAWIALRCGLRVLDEHRATVAATDLRASLSGHRVELAEFGVALALDDGRADRVLRWAEEGRASHLMLRPVRPPEDPGLAQAVAELRATVSDLIAASGEGRSTTRLQRRRLELERIVRDHSRRQRPTPATPAHVLVPIPALAAELADAVLVEYLVNRGDLHAVVVADGRVTVRRLGALAELTALLESIPFALRRMGRTSASAASKGAANALLRHAAEQVDAVVLRPLAGVLRDRPLVIVPTGPLQSLPWSVLPSCLARPVSIAPSAALWVAASRAPDRSGPVVVAAGPGLPGAQAEAAAVAAHHGVDPLLDGRASVGAVTAALDGAHLAHIAAHGNVHPHNPLFSAIHLDDGPLTVYDLERLDRAPETVVLSACHSGAATVLAGDELLGMTATFLAQGTRLVVASVLALPDAETAPLMVAFHARLRAGQGAVVALADAQAGIDPHDHVSVAAAAGFVCLGADRVAVPHEPAGDELVLAVPQPVVRMS